MWIVALVAFVAAALTLCSGFGLGSLLLPAFALSGFLGGVSGHQGALRSAFMVRLGLQKEAFLGTSILCAVIIDIARISYYATDYAVHWQQLLDSWQLLVAGTLSAFLGSYLGRRMIEKVTMEGIRHLVGVMLLLLGVAVSSGLVGSH